MKTFYQKGDACRFINPASCQINPKPKERQRVTISEDLGDKVLLYGYSGEFSKDNIEPVAEDLPIAGRVLVALAVGYVFVYVAIQLFGA